MERCWLFPPTLPMITGPTCGKTFGKFGHLVAQQRDSLFYMLRESRWRRSFHPGRPVSLPDYLCLILGPCQCVTRDASANGGPNTRETRYITYQSPFVCRRCRESGVPGYQKTRHTPTRSPEKVLYYVKIFQISGSLNVRSVQQNIK